MACRPCNEDKAHLTGPEYLAATIVRGRAGTPMPSFGRDSVAYMRLTAPEVLDVIAFIRERFVSPPRAQGAQ